LYKYVDSFVSLDLFFTSSALFYFRYRTHIIRSVHKLQSDKVVEEIEKKEGYVIAWTR